MDWYNKFIVPLWKEYKIWGFVIVLIALMATLTFAQFVLGIEVKEFFRNTIDVLRVNWNS